MLNMFEKCRLRKLFAQHQREKKQTAALDRRPEIIIFIRIRALPRFRQQQQLFVSSDIPEYDCPSLPDLEPM